MNNGPLLQCVSTVLQCIEVLQCSDVLKCSASSVHWSISVQFSAVVCGCAVQCCRALLCWSAILQCSTAHRIAAHFLVAKPWHFTVNSALKKITLHTSQLSVLSVIWEWKINAQYLVQWTGYTLVSAILLFIKYWSLLRQASTQAKAMAESKLSLNWLSVRINLLNIFRSCKPARIRMPTFFNSEVFGPKHLMIKVIFFLISSQMAW